MTINEDTRVRVIEKLLVVKKVVMGEEPEDQGLQWILDDIIRDLGGLQDVSDTE